MQEVEELKYNTETFDMKMLQPSPPRYSSMSPLMTYNEDDLSQSRAADEERGFREYSSTHSDTAWAPIRKTKPKAVGEYDGPTYFNRWPSSPPPLIDYSDCKSAKSSNRCIKKLFY
ncbi:uncharacterized protein LOC111031783 [Myzus persicae]|uniref:uncharacterized protein LOC111027062 n=1 Tax=Myzus persicae TaxID=13164 RepID=UPI000B9339B4|nr:uncharacterized protein LOC111027062 [Myzus persicae]XP_022167565.1 uncharacterized protein LOC111031783 [Myzus persicae]